MSDYWIILVSPDNETRQLYGPFQDRTVLAREIMRLQDEHWDWDIIKLRAVETLYAPDGDDHA